MARDTADGAFHPEHDDLEEAWTKFEALMMAAAVRADPAASVRRLAPTRPRSSPHVVRPAELLPSDPPRAAPHRPASRASRASARRTPSPQGLAAVAALVALSMGGAALWNSEPSFQASTGASASTAAASTVVYPARAPSAEAPWRPARVCAGAGSDCLRGEFYESQGWTVAGMHRDRGAAARFEAQALEIVGRVKAEPPLTFAGDVPPSPSEPGFAGLSPAPMAAGPVAVAPELSTLLEAPGPVQVAAPVPAVSPEPRLRPATATVMIRHAGGGADLLDVKRKVEAAGHEDVTITSSIKTILRTRVRYFDEADRSIAQNLAGLVGAERAVLEAPALGGFLPRWGREGRIEVEIAGEPGR